MVSHDELQTLTASSPGLLAELESDPVEHHGVVLADTARLFNA
jgi:hypothetical protein